MKRTALLFGVGAIVWAAACSEQAPPPNARAPPPITCTKPRLARAVPRVQALVMTRPGDEPLRCAATALNGPTKEEGGRREAGCQLAAEEQARLVKFDKSKMPKHLALRLFREKDPQGARRCSRRS